MPVLSVLMPAYNASSFIKEAIGGILSQELRDLELIVADDGSTDDTREIINEFKDPRIILSHNEQNMGKVETCNRLLEVARGKYITVHDADDCSFPNRFKQQINFLENNKDFILCGCGFETVDILGRVLKVSLPETSYNLIRDNIWTGSQIHGPTIIIRRSQLKKIGGLYRYFKHAEDVDLCFRAMELAPVTNLPEVL